MRCFRYILVMCFITVSLERPLLASKDDDAISLRSQFYIGSLKIGLGALGIWSASQEDGLSNVRMISDGKMHHGCIKDESFCDPAEVILTNYLGGRFLLLYGLYDYSQIFYKLLRRTSIIKKNQ